MEKIVEKENKALWKGISIFGLGLLFLFFLNLFAQQYFFRLDLTEEKRYTISDATRQMLLDLEGCLHAPLPLPLFMKLAEGKKLSPLEKKK